MKKKNLWKHDKHLYLSWYSCDIVRYKRNFINIQVSKNKKIVQEFKVMTLHADIAR